MGKFRTSIFSPEELQKLWKKINRLVVVIIICFILYFIAVLISSRTYSYGSQSYISIECQQEILSRLKSRKLPTKTTVEITQVKGNWKYRFELNGKWYDL